MKCERCEGLMLEDDCIDIETLFDPIWCRAWRCVNCGYVTDSVMMANRQRQRLFLSPDAQLEQTVIHTDRPAVTALAA